MKPALTERAPPYPHAWHNLPNGEAVRQIIELSLSESSRQYFGYHLLRVGSLSCAIELASCPIKHRVNLTRKSTDVSSVVGQSDNLPFSENSIDACLLIHELDFAKDPHQVLREVTRCIIPNGYLVLTGLNPWSLCGLFKYLPFNRNNIMHQARFFSLARVKDWLQLLGFEVVTVRRKVFSELFLGRRLAPDSSWSNWCERYLGWLAGVYILEARKREIPLSMIKPKWKTKPKFATVGASASWREGAVQVRQPWQVK